MARHQTKAGAFLLLIIAIGISTCALASTYEFAELEAWVTQSGGMVKTTVKNNAAGIRGLFTKVDVQEGETLATIPSACMINLASLDSNIAVGTLQLLRELKDPHSRFKPYLDIMPKPGEVLSECDLPRKYWSMLESPHWEARVLSVQSYLARVHAGEVNADLPWIIPELIGTANVTLDELVHACSLVATRSVTVPGRGRHGRIMMVPIFDFANAHAGCKHTTTELKGGNSMRLIAGARMAAGEEWCYPYTRNLMRDDYGVLKYGFLPDLQDPPALMMVDHHDFQGSDSHEVSEDRFTGDAELLKTELARQQATLDELVEKDKVRPPGPAPGTDYVYDLLRSLQERRRNALRYEITRLTMELNKLLLGQPGNPVNSSQAAVVEPHHVTLDSTPKGSHDMADTCHAQTS